MFSSTARHLGTKRRGDVTVKMRVVVVLHLLLYAPRARTWLSDVKHPQQARHVIQSACPRANPPFLSRTCTWSTCPCNRFLHNCLVILQRKAVSVALMPDAIPPAVIFCHTVNLLLQVIYSFPQTESCIISALIMQTDGPEKYSKGCTKVQRTGPARGEDELCLRWSFRCIFWDYEITESRAPNIQMGLTWDKCQTCVWLLDLRRSTPPPFLAVQLTLRCASAGLVLGDRKTLRFDCKQLCLHLLASTAWHNRKDQLLTSAFPYSCKCCFGEQMVVSFIFQFEVCSVIVCNGKRRDRPTEPQRSLLASY